MVKRIMACLVALILLAGVVPNAATAADTVVIEGYLIELNLESEESASSVVIEDYQGTSYHLMVAAPVSFCVDGIPVKCSELRPGLEVIATAQGTKLLSLEAFSTPHPGYVAPGSQTVKGLVTAINRDEITILGDTGMEGRFFVAPFTVVVRSGMAVPVDTLYAGDRVILYLDDIDSGLISRMEIQGDSILISNLYRASLQMVNPLEGRISCSEAGLFKNGTWQQSASAVSFAYSDDLAIYLSGHQIMTPNLKYYRGKTIYLLTRQVMGQEVVDRLIIKGQTEYTYQGRAENVNFMTGQFELNQKNFNLDEGTIVIKDGRLQSGEAIKNDSSLVVIADSWLGQNRSNIVYVTDQGLNNSNLGQRQLYYGRIDLITSDSLWLKKPQKLQNHLFSEDGDEVQLYYGSDSRIYDSVADKWLTAAELLAGSYAVDEDSSYSEANELRDWYGYVYCDNDYIVAMALWPEEAEPDVLRVSTGTVKTAIPDALIGWTVTLDDGYDWSYHNRQWMLKGSQLRLSLDDALVIKNGQAIAPEQLKAGDRLYLLRDDFYIRCAVVK